MAPPGAGRQQPPPPPGGPGAGSGGRLEPTLGQQPDAAVRGGGGDSEGTATERWLAAWLERSGVTPRCSENAAKRNTAKAINLSGLRELPAADLARPETAAQLRRLVAQRRRRRQAERRRRQAERQRLQRRHAEIDAWQADIRQQAAKRQEAEEVKREADSVLGEVRRKISDVEKHLETLEELRTLRQARDLKARAAGLFSSAASDQRFAEVTARLTALLDRHLETYEAELRALRAMTGPPPPEVGTAAPAAAAAPPAVLRALFGASGVTAAAAAAAAAGSKTEQTDHLVHMVDWKADPQTLLDIRSDWDRYLVGPEDRLGSAAPPTWVVPAPPTSAVWASYLAT